ncbi:RNA-directed DNA polymerase from mobile element jockey-like [Brachionus plicatilis]|uniref:RNA-directed DNA polymerase from mobile element jockey-like n=1 Tax=Brachionus plicatilis TaxID=10195 RepID=A0A3M7SJ98_BRAPC|nr:RNA-directed DNA polymerase from mobile element jockey-like [Brachionus plicatilis]
MVFTTQSIENCPVWIPITKDEKKTINDTNIIRPITISDVISSIFEKIMLIEILKTRTDPDKQLGFKKNSSCSHAVATVFDNLKLEQPNTENLCSGRTNRRSIARCLYNCCPKLTCPKFTCRINYVEFILVENSLSKTGIFSHAIFSNLCNKCNNLQIWRCLKNYYDESMALLMNGINISSLFKTTIGVKQGGPLSPKLFSIYVKGLIKEIESKKIHKLYTEKIMYADDILLLLPGIKEPQEALFICEKYGIKN